jgi:hypothetical protein
VRYHRASGPGKQREGAISKPVLLGWGFWFQVTVCPPRRARMSKSGGGLAEFVSMSVKITERLTQAQKPGWGILGVLSRATPPDQAYGRVADFLRCPVASGKSTSFCASFTLSINEPPPFISSILTMSAKSAYCTTACDALFLSLIFGEL